MAKSHLFYERSPQPFGHGLQLAAAVDRKIKTTHLINLAMSAMLGCEPETRLTYPDSWPYVTTLARLMQIRANRLIDHPNAINAIAAHILDPCVIKLRPNPRF